MVNDNLAQEKRKWSSTPNEWGLPYGKHCYCITCISILYDILLPFFTYFPLTLDLRFTKCIQRWVSKSFPHIYTTFSLSTFQVHGQLGPKIIFQVFFNFKTIGKDRTADSSGPFISLLSRKSSPSYPRNQETSSPPPPFQKPACATKFPSSQIHPPSLMYPRLSKPSGDFVHMLKQQPYHHPSPRSTPYSSGLFSALPPAP